MTTDHQPSKPAYQYIVALALKEDVGLGDITTEATYHGDEMAEAEFIAKEDGIIAGLELAAYIFQQLDDQISLDSSLKDGNHVQRGQLVATAYGPTNRLLTAERTVLNFMQRMSGVASVAHQYVEAIQGTGTKILDTRKTIPGHRYLDKWAVRLGGGNNHRMRLDDLFLIKENHIAMAGGIKQAIQRCQAYKHSHSLDVKIEIEVPDLDTLDQVLKVGGVDIVMLDNMSLLDMSTAVQQVKGSITTEASGNVTLERVRSIAETGVDFISVGAITHSAKALDISMLLNE
ncbi:MAG: carboxylating nicotinate-nucleotide diphosphorylase [Bacteroidota bacterium]